MKYLLTAILFAFLSLSAYSQITGVWFSDYQNIGIAECAPGSLTINETSQNNYTITYTYSEGTLEIYCGSNFTANYTTNLTQNLTTGVWVDGKGQQLIYNSSLQTIQYLISNGNPLLFDRTGAYISQNLVFPYIGGNWINPKAISGDNCTCAPSSIVLSTETGETFIQYDTFSNCSAPVSNNAYITIGSTNKMNWTDYSSNNSIIFNPSTPNNLTVQLKADGCTYTYEKYTGFTPLNGTWVLDWQSNFYQEFAPAIYQVFPGINNSNLIANVTYSYSSSESYIVGLSKNHYFDLNNGFNYTYDATTDTLMGAYNEDEYLNYTILLSHNGSVLPFDVVDSYWINPRGVNGSALPDTCCVPYYISITPDSYTYNIDAEYYFASGYTNNSGCQNISQNISPYMPESSIGATVTFFQVNTPSLTQVTWTDEYSNKMQFANLSEITVTNFFNQCSFTMEFASTRPNLSATSISQGIFSLVLALLTVMIFV